MTGILAGKIRARLRIVAGAVLVFSALSGCDRTEEEDPSVASDSDESSGRELTEGKFSAITFSDAGGDDPALMSLDPREDGWNSEHLNAIASAQLAKLGEAFESGGFAEGAALGSIFSEKVECDPLRPGELDKVFDDGSTVVLRPAMPLPDSRAFTPTPWTGRFVELTRSAPVGGERHFKFKIIGVGIRPDGFETEQLVSFSAGGSGAVWEQNATWRIEWQLKEGASDPVIASVRLEAFEEVSRSGGGAWFTDCTRAVFANGIEMATGQFGVGVGDWKERLNDHLLVMQFGHNGIAFGDVNGDGLEDIYRCQLGGLPNRLLLGQPDGTVRDHSRAAGLDFLDNCRGALFVDLDNDGDQDLALAMPLQIVLFKNDGAGNFEIGAQIVQENVFTLAAADFDLDGDLDIYACVYYAEREVVAKLPIPIPIYDAKNGGRNVLLRNDGDWRFVDATDGAGLGEDNSRFSFAAIWEDYDNDGAIDLFVVNDSGFNNLFRNLGDGKFRHVTTGSGTANGTFGMSASAGDYNRDGWMDLYKASMFSSAGHRVATQPQFIPTADESLRRTMLQMARGNTLFANDGKGAFRDQGTEAGVAMGRWSWGSIFMDFNNDGWEDLFVTNGFVTGRNPGDL